MTSPPAYTPMASDKSANTCSKRAESNAVFWKQECQSLADDLSKTIKSKLEVGAFVEAMTVYEQKKQLFAKAYYFPVLEAYKDIRADLMKILDYIRWKDVGCVKVHAELQELMEEYHGRCDAADSGKPLPPPRKPVSWKIVDVPEKV